MNTQQALALPAPRASDTVVVNARCTLQIEDDLRVVVVAGLPAHHYRADDAVAEAYAMVFLVDSGFAQQNEVARAFSCSERTVRRYQDRYENGGMAALGKGRGWRRGRRRTSGRRLRTIEKLRSQGLSNRNIAVRLGVDEKAIRKQVGPSKPAEQFVFPTVSNSKTPDELSDQPSRSADHIGTEYTTDEHCDEGVNSERHTDEADDACEPVPMSLDVDASDRSFDRLLACMGLLDDAAPIFRDGSQVAGAGVLWAVPLLVHSEIFRISRKLYGEIGPAFYGLRTTLLTLLFMALLRIKRPEHLKERDPAMLGRVIGLDRAPEVKTLRRKLTRLAAYQRAEQLGAELARVRVEQRGQMMGFLYVDGHVRAYHGKHTISQAYVPRRRLAMPATTDYWVNDQAGDPVFVLTTEVNVAMTTTLPEVLREIRTLVGNRRVTIVFDRGGWSPKLFHQMLADKFDILTYRKFKGRRVNEKRFARRRAKIDGRWVTYVLHDQAVRFLKGKLRLRQVTRLTDTGHQTQVITSRWDLRDIEVAYRMFERWRQENFFKYMRDEFLIDALADHQVEPVDPTRTVPNPERRALDKQIRGVRTEIAKLEQQYGAAALDNPEGSRPTMRGFKIAHARLGKKLQAERARLTKLVARRRPLPKRVEVCDPSNTAVVKLATERKHLTTLIKMVAYQTESDLLALLRPHYARAEDEGRTLLHELFCASAQIHVSHTELHVTLSPLSSPHRTLAVQALCEELNKTATTFPGSNLRLTFAVHPPPVRGLAFPGPRAQEADTSAHG